MFLSVMNRERLQQAPLAIHFGLPLLADISWKNRHAPDLVLLHFAIVSAVPTCCDIRLSWFFRVLGEMIVRKCLTVLPQGAVCIGSPKRDAEALEHSPE